MEFKWKDTVVLITGAARGIGAVVTRILLNEEGIKQITILDLDEKNATELKNELNTKYGNEKVKFIKCDVTNEEHLLKSYEAVLGDKTNEYVVINGAGILNDSWKTYRKEIDINVTSVITGTLKALDLMRKDQGGKGGTIINISSVAALHPMPYTPIYNATKSAVMQFSVGVGADDYYLNTGVRILTMCFGATDTGLIVLENMGNFDKEVEKKLIVALNTYPGQSIESAARGVIDMHKKGKSASIWLSNNNKPVEDITEVHKKAYALLAATEIVILDLDEKNATELQNELKAKHGNEKVKFIKCDVTNEEHLLKSYEAVLGDKTNEYVVIHSAGILNDSWETYRKEIDINLKSVVTGTLKALDLMRKDQGGKGGTIINISSVVALRPLPYTPIYNATKSAVMQFSVGVGADDYYLNTGVRVLTICFGSTDTGLIALENMGTFDKEMEKAIEIVVTSNTYPAQTVESAARGLIDMHKKGKSASIWFSNNNKPVEDITEVHKKAYELLAATVFN